MSLRPRRRRATRAASALAAFAAAAPSALVGAQSLVPSQSLAARPPQSLMGVFFVIFWRGVVAARGGGEPPSWRFSLNFVSVPVAGLLKSSMVSGVGVYLEKKRGGGGGTQ